MDDGRDGRGLAMGDPVGDDERGRGPAGYLLDAIRSRPAAKRTLTVVSALLFLAGLGVFAYPLATDIYAERILQQQLEDEFQQPELRDDYARNAVETGDPLTRIVIPELGVESLVVEGTNMAALRAGAGHYPNTPLPGGRGNVAIAGHRTTYGKPFSDLDELPVGAKIRLETPVATQIYEVVPPPQGHNGQACQGAGCWITHPSDWSVIEPTRDATLTLTTCHPRGSARQRLIVRGELVDTVETAAKDVGA